MAVKRRTIGQLAKAVGIGVETIRFYERRGLIRRPVSPDRGYRHYGDDVLAAVRYIRLAQQLGLSLKDIEQLKAHLDDRTRFCGAVRAAVTRKIEEVTEQLATLARLKTELEGFAERCKTRPISVTCPILDDLTRADGSVSATADRARADR
jgi:DNA-binding transcriptional MerR regulator